MAKFGCPAKFITMVRQFHDGMQARVQNDGVYSKPFPATSAVNQGCVLASTLFSMMFSAMLTDAFCLGDIGVNFKFQADGKPFNLLRLQTKTKVQKGIARGFLFADDCALNAGTQSIMQESLNRFAKACDNFGLTISIKKTEVMYQPAPKALYTKPVITVNGEKLTVAKKFIYLGSTLSHSVSIDKKVLYRIARASSAFGTLRKKVWERRGISLLTKLKVYRAIILPTLLYTWIVYGRHARQLNFFHMRCLRKLLCIRWQNKVPDTEVLQRAKMGSIRVFLKSFQLR